MPEESAVLYEDYTGIWQLIKTEKTDEVHVLVVGGVTLEDLTP